MNILLDRQRVEEHGRSGKAERQRGRTGVLDGAHRLTGDGKAQARVRFAPGAAHRGVRLSSIPVFLATMSRYFLQREVKKSFTTPLLLRRGAPGALERRGLTPGAHPATGRQGRRSPAMRRGPRVSSVTEIPQAWAGGEGIHRRSRPADSADLRTGKGGNGRRTHRRGAPVPRSPDRPGDVERDPQR